MLHIAPVRLSVCLWAAERVLWFHVLLSPLHLLVVINMQYVLAEKCRWWDFCSEGDLVFVPNVRNNLVLCVAG